MFTGGIPSRVFGAMLPVYAHALLMIPLALWHSQHGILQNAGKSGTFVSEGSVTRLLFLGGPGASSGHPTEQGILFGACG